jgi:hypothetical protein
MSDTLQPARTPETLFAERSARFDDALALRRPDRVPVLARFGGMLAELAGVAKQALYEDPALAQRALDSAMLRFQPDSGSGMWHTPGPSLALGDRSTRWPGHGNDPNASFQYVESEFMKAEDYDAFLADPSDWAIRTYLPRVFGELEGLSQLPPLSFAAFGYYAAFQFSHLFALPQMTRAFEALAKAGREQLAWIGSQRESARRLRELGFPSLALMRGSLVEAPFDFISDTLRGMRGIFLDMRRCPEKLLAAEEKAIGIQIEAAAAICRAKSVPYAFFPLHRGSDGFISLPAFERFYWPQLKTMLLRLIDLGITPVVFYEGCWDQRLPYLAELPKGKTIGMFQSTDIFKAKQALDGVMCIMGGMPVGMLMSATPREVRDYTREVCMSVGRGGGFIMTTGVGDLEGCDPELVRAWIDAAKEVAPA